MARWHRPSDEIADGSPTRRVLNGSAAIGALTALIVLAVGWALLTPEAHAKQRFMSDFAEAYPAAAGTSLDSCVLCHTDPVNPREENVNSYGEDWEDEEIGNENFLAPALVNRDSDGDGVPNGQEIEQLSLPGDPSSSTPSTTTTTIPGTPPDGQALYEARCAVCHGPDGGDLTGTGLSRSSFITITLNGQGSMPPQTNLTSEEAGAIWDFVTGAVPTTTTTTQPGATTTTTVPADGATVWAQHCSVCHGAAGGNVVPTTLSKSQLVSITTNGVGTMRGFPELGSAQISNVADYLLALSVPPTTLPGATTTTTAPRSGAAVYAASCALCHGADGGNLRGHTLSLAEIVSITTNGIGTMGGYAGKLSAAEIDNVSAYVAAVGVAAGVTTTTLPPDSPLDGSTLYMQHCAACHGLHGEGGPGGAVAGTSLTRSQIISVTTDGTSGMPGYGSQMTTDEIAAVADHILAMAGSESDTGGTPAEEETGTGSTVPPELAEGHALYGQFCAACHGSTGEGGPGGPVAGIGTDSAVMEDIIRNGVGSMPGFGDQMTEAEIEALVAFSEALAAGRSFDSATTTTLRIEDRTLAAPSPVLVPGSDTDAADGSSTGIYVVIVVGALIAGTLVFFWLRTARKLFF